MKKFYLFLLLLTLNSTILFAQVFVTETGAGNKNGSDWNNAYDNTQLQQAINEAENATVKQVWVAKGTYKPTESLSSTGKLTDGTDVTDQDRAFILKTGVAVYGGFVGNESSINDRILPNIIGDNIPINPNETILSGDLNNNGIADDGDCYHVVASRNASLGAVLDGFTIKYGFANGATGTSITEGGEAIDRDRGAAIMLRGTNTAMTFANLIIVNNESAAFSAGVQLRGSGANKQYNFSNVRFENNKGGGSGGALYIYYTNSTTTLNITDCVFKGNSGAGDGGGAIITANSAGTANITGTKFINNSHTTYGGALRLGVGTANIVNCDFIGNSSRRGAIYTTAAATTNIERSRFNNNEATTEDGGQVYIYSGTLNILKSSFYNGKALAGNGGAIYIRSSGEAARTSTVHVSNSTFYNNVATLGGAIYITRNTFESNPNASSLTAVNNTFYANKCTDASGGAIYFVNNAEVTLNLYNNIFNGNLHNYDANNQTGGTSYDFRRGYTTATQKYYYNLVQSNTNLTDNGGRTVTPDPVNIPGNTNIVNANPALLFASTTEGDYNFLWPVQGGASVDVGDNGLYTTNVGDATDFLGNTRNSGTGLDLGAIEWSSVLPVKVSSFTANLINSRTQLKWSVGTEENVSHYEVQRSQNGTDFITVAKVTANGLASYQATDNNPQVGDNYYRLVTLDNDGSHSKYNVIRVVKVASLYTQNVKVYPNPVKGNEVKVSLGNASGAYSYKIVSTSGSVVQQGNVNYNGSSAIINLSSAVASGIYVLHFSNGTQGKLVKQ